MTIYVRHPTEPKTVTLNGEDITPLCFWADDVTGEACLFVEKDGVQQTYKVKGLGVMLTTERKYGAIVISG